MPVAIKMNRFIYGAHDGLKIFLNSLLNFHIGQIGHDHEETQNVTWCKGDGCFSLKLEYSVPDNQISALIQSSDYCEQEIYFQVEATRFNEYALTIFHISV